METSFYPMETSESTSPVGTEGNEGPSGVEDLRVFEGVDHSGHVHGDHVTPLEHDDHQYDDEEPTCRVCHMEAEPDRPLYHPCWCRGSIKHVHQDCLLQWLAASKNTSRRCELCGGSLTFAPVYAQGAPKVLSVWELAGGLASKLLSHWPTVLQSGLLFIMWLLILPLTTSAVFQVYFCASVPELQALLSLVSTLQPRDLVAECLGGTVLCMSIVVISLVAIGIRDSIMTQLGAWGGRGGQGEGEGPMNEDAAPGTDGGAEDRDEAHEGEGGHGGEEREAFRPLVWGMGRGQQADVMDDDFLDQMVDLRELLGLQGPLPVTLRRWAQLWGYNLAFLTLFQLLPYHLGRVLWSLLAPHAAASLDPSVGPASTPTELLLHLSRSLTDKLLLETTVGGVSSAISTPPPPLSADSLGLLLDKLLTLGLGYAFLFVLLALVTTAHAMAITLQDPAQALRGLHFLQRGCLWLASWLKITLFVLSDLIVMPLLLGAVMDVATVDMFNSTITRRVTFLLDWPFVSICAHWLCGFTFMALAGLLATELRRLLHPDVLRTLLPQPPGADHMGANLGNQDLDDSATVALASRSLTEHARRLLLSLLLYLPLLLLLLYLPIKFGHRLLPHTQPLRLHFMSTSALYLEMQLPIELFLFHVALPIVLERFRLRDTVRWCLETLFASLCRWLSLGPWLLDSDAQTPPPPPPSLLPLRLALLSTLSCLALFLSSTLALHVPIRLGRAMLARVQLPTDHDFYNVGIGLLASWLLLYTLKTAFRTLRATLPAVARETLGVTAWGRRLGSFVAIAVKATVLAAIWLLVLPVVIGMLFELVVIIPARVPLDETPFISRYEAWALGLVFLKIWVRCTMLGVFGNDYAYKVRFEKIKTNGLRRLDFTYTMVEVVLPLLWHLSCLLMTPHFIITAVDLVLSRDLAADPPLLPPGLSFDEAENALLMLKRHGYMVYVLLRATLLGLGLAKQGLCHLHDRIRDDQYLVGLELKNRVLDDKDADPSTITT